MNYLSLSGAVGVSSLFVLALDVSGQTFSNAQATVGLQSAIKQQSNSEVYVSIPYITNTGTYPDKQQPAELQRVQQVMDVIRGDFGRHKVVFVSDIGAERPIELITPDGRHLGFRPCFLGYYDASTRRSVLLAEIQQGYGQAGIQSPARVLYGNVFKDLKADIRYDYGLNSLEQNVIIRQRPPKPEEFGCDPETTRLEMWTEWFEAEPRQIEQFSIFMREGSDREVVHGDDITLDFGTMKIVQGKAFELLNPNRSVAVAKEWQQMGHRRFLIESVDYRAIQPQIDSLPVTASLSPRKTFENRADIIKALAVNRIELKKQPKALVASATAYSAPGVVLDFTIVNSIPLPQGVVSWWPAGGSTNDAAGGNNGILVNGAEYAAGEVGQAFRVGGNSSYVKIPYSSSLEFSNQLTIEFWMKADATNAMNTYQGLVTSDFYGIEISNGWGGTMGVNFFMSVDGGANWPMISSVNGGGAVVSANVWHHVAGTYDGTQMKLYIDGQQWGDAFALSGNISPMLTNSFLAIGSEAGRTVCGCSRFFNGLVDEVTIYNRALASSEIQDIFDAGGAGKYNPNCVNPYTNAVGWWPGDGNAYDVARTNCGMLQGYSNYSSSQIEQGFKLNGTNAYVEVSDNASLNPTSAISVECWLYREAAVGSWDPVVKKTGSAGSQVGGYSLEFSGNNIVFWVYNGTWRSSASLTLQNNRWYHIAGVYTGTNLLCYVNGVPVGSPVNTSGAIVTASNPLRIGNDASNPSRFFKGSIDEVAIYNRALSGTEISGIYAAGSAGKCKIDSDNDGLTDLQENFLGTNLNNPDTDGDGYLDGDEAFVRHTDPHLYNSPNGLTSGNGLQVFTPLQ